MYNRKLQRIVCAFLLVFVLSLLIRGGQASQQVLLSNKRNPQIEKIVSEISAANIEASIRKLAGFGTRHVLSPQDDPKRGIGAAQRWLRDEFERYSRESGGRLQVSEDVFLQQPRDWLPPWMNGVKLTNIVATLPGTQAEAKDRVYVVSGHYDSIVSSASSDGTIDAPGANDDASGTAAVLELARVMSKYQFDATIVFLAVTGEEVGLLGATHWAEEAKKKGVQVAAMFTNDIIGNTVGMDGVKDNRRVRVFSEGVPWNETEAEAKLRRIYGGENDGPSRQLARYIKEAGERYLPDFEVSLVLRWDRLARGGDHRAFLERGFSAVRFTEPNEDLTRQHQQVREENGISYGDVPEKVDFAYAAQVARVNAAALASMAFAPASPASLTFKQPVNRRQPGQGGYDLTLTWQKNKEPDVIGYQLVWRETSQPTWQRSLFIGDVTEYVTKGLSRDDYFFAVQAVDKDGNVSVPAFPKPPTR
jgi:hypothetical protein